MSKRFWVARAARGTMKIEGIVASFDDERIAIESRTKMQGETHAGLSGDVFVVIDSMHLPVPDIDLNDEWHGLYDKWLRRDQQLSNHWAW